jgi:HK97 family phage major capsid protein
MMTAQQPIPLRADPAALARAERRSFVRLCTAKALAARPGAPSASAIAKAAGWDDMDRVVRTPQTATGTGAYPQQQSVRILPALAPASASAKLLALATVLDLTGITSISLPNFLPSAQPSAVFVGEDAPAPLVDLIAGSTVLGPAKKILFLIALTGELRAASAQNAEVLVGQALEIAAGRAIDAALFGASAGSATTPLGLLFGVTPVASAGGTGLNGAAADVGKLAGAFGAIGVAADSLVIICSPTTATQLRALIGLRFGNVILGSAAVADGTLIGVLPAGLAVGYAGAADVETSESATAQFEAAPTSDLLTGFPVRSAYQEYFTLLRVRARCAWAALPGSIAAVSGCAW